MTLFLPADLAEAIRRHLERAYPEEAAGLLLGTADGADKRRVVRALPVDNRWEGSDRVRRYTIDPRDLMRAEDEANRDGLTVIGIFHSHPDHPPRPSTFDLEQGLPFYTYLITRVDGGSAVETRAWRLADDRLRFDEESLVISDEVTR